MVNVDIFTWLSCPECGEDVGWTVGVDEDGASEAELTDKKCDCDWSKHIMTVQRGIASEQGMEDARLLSPFDDGDAAYEAMKNGDNA